MKNTEIVTKIKTLLNMEVKLEEMKLENGTLVEADSFEKGKEIFIKTDDERVAMPVGEYMFEDGRLLVVEEEGIIADMREVSDEVPAKEDAESEEEKTEDLEEKEDGYAEEDDMMRDMMGRIQNLEDAISDLKSKIGEKKMGEDEKILKSRTVKEEFSEEKVEASADPIKHSPEASFGKIENKVFAKGNFNTTLDRVMAKLNKKNN
tara:strand:- start:378 stop:995 length:618 start_codon:yes stop_codon:yes gene_type:complete